MDHRVRGIVLTGTNSVLLIKRLRDDMAPYWVAPGGGIEESDASPEAAVCREIAEELGAQVEVLRQAFEADMINDYGHFTHQTFYLCRLLSFDPARRDGPEFHGEGIGEYLPDEIPLTRAHIAALSIRPDALRDTLLELCP